MVLSMGPERDVDKISLRDGKAMSSDRVWVIIELTVDTDFQNEGGLCREVLVKQSDSNQIMRSRKTQVLRF